MLPPASVHRNAIASPIARGVTQFEKLASGIASRLAGVSIVDGMIAVAVIPCAAFSAASVSVRFSKAALLVYGLALRPRLGAEGVGVTVVCPGFVKTPMTDRLRGPMPGLMADDRAATLIVRRLRRDPAILAFPFWPALGIRVMGLLPGWVSGRIWRIFDYSAKPEQG